jgi:hypothetical protein
MPHEPVAIAPIHSIRVMRESADANALMRRPVQRIAGLAAGRRSIGSFVTPNSG